MTEIQELQLELDVKKWIESERAGKDLCGSYAFCEYCDKELKYPCAEAYNLAQEDEGDAEEETVTEEVVNEDGTVTIKVKYRALSFQEKLDKAKDETKEKYEALKKLIEDANYSFKMLRRFVVVRYQGILCGKVTLVRNSLRFHMALNPKTYERYTHFDFGHFKCYQQVPFTIKYDTKKAFKSTEALLPILAKKAAKLASK